MNLSDLIAFCEQLFNFRRILIAIIIGCMSLFIDSRFMAKRGLRRESVWAVIFGCILIFGGLGIWIVLQILA